MKSSEPPPWVCYDEFHILSSNEDGQNFYSMGVFYKNNLMNVYTIHDKIFLETQNCFELDSVMFFSKTLHIRLFFNQPTSISTLRSCTAWVAV